MRSRIVLAALLVLAVASIALAQVDSGAASTLVVPSADTSGIRVAWLEYQETDSAAYQTASRFLSGSLGVPVTHEVFRDYEYEEIARRMDPALPAGQRIDVAVLTPYGYLSVKRLKRGVTAFASYVRAGLPTYRAHIAWRASGRLQSADEVVKALRDSSHLAMALVNERSTSGFQIPFAWMLSRHNVDLRSDIRTVMTGSHSASLDSVAGKGRIFAAAVWDGALDQFKVDHPTAAQRIRSEPIGISIRHDAAAIRAGFPAAMRAAIRRAFIDMDNSPVGKTALRLFRRQMSGWVGAEDKDYDNLRGFTQAEFPQLRIRVAEITAVRPEDTVDLRPAIEEHLEDGWFQLAAAGQEADVTITVHVEGTPHGRVAHLRDISGITARGAQEASVRGSNPDELARLIIEWLKQQHPLQAYLAEYGVDAQRGYVVSIGTDRAVMRGAAVEIVIRDARALSGMSIVTAQIAARVREASREGAWIELLDRRDSTRLRLDPSDHVSYLARIFPGETAALPDSLRVSLGQPTIARDGSVWLPLTVHLLQRGKVVQAGPAGFEIELEAVTAFRTAPSGRRVGLIPPRASQLQDSLLLTGSALGSVVRVSTPHSTRLRLDATVGMLVLWSLVAWAILGGLIGGVISEWGTKLDKVVDDWRQDKKRLMARTALAMLVGAISGLLLYLIVVLVPELIDKGKILSHAVSGIAGQFLSGLLGGFIGAHAIVALVKKWMDGEPVRASGT